MFDQPIPLFRAPFRLTSSDDSLHVDQEGGRVQRFRSGFSLLPPVRRIGHQYDLDSRAGLDLARHMGWLMAAELRAHRRQDFLRKRMLLPRAEARIQRCGQYLGRHRLIDRRIDGPAAFT